MTPDQLRLDAQIRQLQAAREEDRRKWRELEVRNAMLGHRFSSQQSKRDAFEIILAKLDAKNDDPDLNVAAFVEEEISKRPAWQQPVAQERPTKAVPAAEREPREVDVDSIDGDSTPEEVEAYRQSIIRSLPPLRERRY